MLTINVYKLYLCEDRKRVQLGDRVMRFLLNASVNKSDDNIIGWFIYVRLI